MNQSAKRAINLMGGRKAAAARFGISYEAVRKWEESGVPMRRCAEVVRALSGQMSLMDFYPEFQAEKPAAPKQTHLRSASS